MKGNICDYLNINREDFENKKMRFEFRFHNKRDRNGSLEFNRSILFCLHNNAELTFDDACIFMRSAELLVRKFYKHPTVSLWLVDGDSVILIDAQH